MDLQEICEKTLKKVEESGADQAEVFVIKARMINTYVETGKIQMITNNSWVGLGIKMVIDKRVGYIAGLISSPNEIEELIKEGISITKISPRDEKFESLPEPKQISGVIEGVFDENILELGADEFAGLAKRITNNAERNDVKVMNGLIRATVFEFNVENSLGIDFTHKGSTIFVHFSAKKMLGEGIIKKYATCIDRIDWDAAGQELMEKTLLSADAISFKGKETMEVIIEPMELEGMLSDILMAASGENVNRNRSPWINKIGEKVASDSLTIVDNGRMPYGLRSALADDEGVPTTVKPIIERGVLKNYYYDHYNAVIAGIESTGNGFRRGIRTLEDAHLGPSSCVPSNIEVISGSKNLDQLIGEMDRGILIKKFAYPTVDFLSGNFGLEIRSAVLIENGEEKAPVKHALLVGNMYEALKNITGIAKEQEIIEYFKLPAIRFGNLQVVGIT